MSLREITFLQGTATGQFPVLQCWFPPSPYLCSHGLQLVGQKHEIKLAEGGVGRSSGNWRGNGDYGIIFHCIHVGNSQRIKIGVKSFSFIQPPQTGKNLPHVLTVSTWFSAFWSACAFWSFSFKSWAVELNPVWMSRLSHLSKMQHDQCYFENVNWVRKFICFFFPN